MNGRNCCFNSIIYLFFFRFHRFDDTDEYEQYESNIDLLESQIDDGSNEWWSEVAKN